MLLAFGRMLKSVVVYNPRKYYPGSKTTCPSFRSLIFCRSTKLDVRYMKPLSAVGSGLEATITDPSNNDVRIKNAEITVESKDENKMQVRVDLTGKETDIVFEKVLRNLARTAPPVPGFRREKGGKTSKVPRDFLLQILGEDRVTKFVIQEIITSTLADYVKKENLTVKDNKINTIQTAEELKAVFIPGDNFGFNATLELENSAESLAEVELSV
ncbi:uncharacterized protein LOC142547516 isoform X3 [Primulina tabacum]|uniref:uncharacterized protein LOC142547516 isoform X3 n=1 Tax=Primulina tabacum TaxID=48773 RepID=UPI003F5A4BDD